MPTYTGEGGTITLWDGDLGTDAGRTDGVTVTVTSTTQVRSNQFDAEYLEKSNKKEPLA